VGGTQADEAATAADLAASRSFQSQSIINIILII